MKTIDLTVLVIGLLINSCLSFLAGHFCGRGEVFEELWDNLQFMTYEGDEEDETD